MSKANDEGDSGRGRETGVSRAGEQRAEHALRTVGSQGGAIATTSHPLRMTRFTGTVQRGSRRASALGYPTINLSVDDPNLSGVYAARVELPDGEVREAAAFADPSRKLLEAHIFGYDRDVYGQTATIELHKKLRESEVFTNDEKLREAIARDVAAVREYFDHA